jgi:hypothetical protein
MRVVIEAAASMGWEKYVGDGAHFIAYERASGRRPPAERWPRYSVSRSIMSSTPYARIRS